MMDEVTVKDNTQELVCEWSELGERSGHIFDMFPHLKDIQCDLMAGLKCGMRRLDEEISLYTPRLSME